MNVFAITLPLPPSDNNAFRNVSGVGRVKTGEYRAWRKGAAMMIRAAWKAQGSPAFDKHLTLTIHMGLDYRGDIRGRIKGIEDALVEAIPGFPDDRYIDKLDVERVPGIDGARILVQQASRPTGEARPIGEIIKPIIARIASGMEDAA